MSKNQFVLTLLVATFSAFLGGTFGVWLLMPPSVMAQDEVQKVIEAQEFRVVDEDGVVRGSIGLNQSGVTLNFRDVTGTKSAEVLVTEIGVGIVLSDESQESAIRMMTGESSGYSSISITAAESTLIATPNILTVSHPAGSILVDAEKPMIRVADSRHAPRAILGVTSLTPPTGSTEIRAPSSLVLFDEEGNVVWSAP